MPISRITGASIEDGSIVIADLGITTFNTGTGNTLTLQANSATGLVIDVTGNTAIANSLSFSATGARIRGDFSNATLANRVAFQTSTANASTRISAFPNGTSRASSFDVYADSDPTNSSTGIFAMNGVDLRIQSAITGTGTYLPMTFYTSGSERLRIDTSGNVGIGTTSAAEKLRVTGTGTTEIRVNSQTSGDARVGFWAEGAAYNYIQSVRSSGALGYYADSHIFLNTSTTERMRIDSSGRLGINTTSPSQLLHVAAGNILASNTSTNSATVAIAGNGSTVGTSAFELIQGGSSEAYVYNRANSFLVLGTNNTERMRITAGGAVGIGTNNPGANLQIGSASFAPNGNLGNNLLQIKSPSGFAYVTIGNGDQANSTSYIGGASGFTTIGTVLDNGSITEHFRITNTGNVGIGTNNPSATLDVRRGVTGQAFQIIKPNVSTGGANIYMQSDSGNSGTAVQFNWGAEAYTNGVGGGGTANAYPLTFFTNGAERMRIDSAGRVGISATPLAWNSPALQGNSFAISSLLGIDQTGWSTGCYQDAYGYDTGWKFKGSYAATLYTQTGSHNFLVTGSTVGAGNAITWSTAMSIAGNGNLQFNSGYGSAATAYGCRAWVSFNGTTSPGTIRGSGNVTSVSKGGTGFYTVNFTTAMPDTNFATHFTVNGSAAGGSFGNVDIPGSTSSVNLTTRIRSSGNGSDESGAFVAVFR